MEQPSLPAWLKKLLLGFCHPRFHDEIEGDLHELYQENIEIYGRKYANRQLLLQTARYFRPYFFNHELLKFRIFKSRIMFRSYLHSIVRNFGKYRFYSLLNSLGLALGFSIFAFILIFLQYQENFESFHSKADRIFRATYYFSNNQDFEVHWARVPFDYINQLPEEYPEIERFVRLQNQEQKYVKINEEKYKPQFAYTTDPEIFQVFDFTSLSGDLEQALTQPHSVVLTQSTAERYYGSTDAVGQEMRVTGTFNSEEVIYRVTAVVEDLPGNTHLPVDMLLSFNDPSERTGWAYVYALLKEGSDIQAIQVEMPEFIRRNSETEENQEADIVFQALPDIHLHSNLAREIIPNGNIFFVKLFRMVGLFVLLIALINFINLSSALSLSKADEIGMRKVLGARKSHLFLYALVESFFFNLLAFVLALGFTYILFPLFSRLSGIATIVDPNALILFLVAIMFLSTVLAAIYPALVMQSFPILSLIKNMKSRLSPRKNGIFSFKRILVSLQFAASITLILFALSSFRQLNYMEDKNLGISKDQVLAIPAVPDNVTDNYVTFKERCRQLPGIQEVGACMEVPSREIRDAGTVLLLGQISDRSEAPLMDIQVIDQGFMEVMNVQLVAGDLSTARFGPDTVPQLTEEYTFFDYLADKPRTYLINETAMRKFGWENPEAALGQQISWGNGAFELAMGPIVGIVKDYNQETLKNEIESVVLTYEPIWLSNFLLKVKTADIQSTVAAVDNIWDEMFPNLPFEYHFVDELYDNLYKSERVQTNLLSIFSLFSIVIAFLGLIGLLAYALRSRMKELAIRKVLGANLSSIIRMISREYLIIVLISSIIAIPFSIYWIRKWLQNFVYHTEISIWPFVGVVVLVVLLLIITVAIQSFLGTRTNPVRYLMED